MKRRKRKPLLSRAPVFFVTVAALVTVALIAYGTVSGASNVVVACVMFSVILGVSLVCTIIDYFRRRYTVDQPVEKILEATDKIASGDFGARIGIAHSLRRYDAFDYISENFNQMAAELEHTESLHSDFISNVSHELKTPLAVIQSYAALLTEKELDEETRAEYAQTLVTAAKRLTALVGNILKLNKLENGQIEPEAERIELSESLTEAVLGFEELIEQKGLLLECEIAEGVRVTAPPDYLEIVWNNLISNAIKFTERGGKIVVSLRRDGGYAVAEVSDTGCGISAETGAHIFDKFYQGDTSHAQEGNGLGLALVKKVIDLTGGTIAVDSEKGKGSTFTVWLKAED